MSTTIDVISDPVEPRPARRLPFGPFEQVVMSRIAEHVADRSEGQGVVSLLGESGYRRYLDGRRKGYLSDTVADRLCVNRLRIHPSEIWGPTWFELLPPSPWSSGRATGKTFEDGERSQDLVGTRMAMQICGVSLSTITHWVDTGRLPCVTNCPLRLFRRSDLETLQLVMAEGQ